MVSTLFYSVVIAMGPNLSHQLKNDKDRPLSARIVMEDMSITTKITTYSLGVDFLVSASARSKCLGYDSKVAAWGRAHR